MKKLILLFITFTALLSFNACSDDNEPVFVAKQDVDGIAFTNSFAANYLIAPATKANIADRFIWESADFGVATNVTYELQGATKADFSDVTVVGTTSENNLPVTVDQLLGFARNLGLDGDPLTTNADGSANNKGQVYFRVKASAGTNGANETLSEPQVISVEWIETVAVGTGCPSLWAVGAALVNIDWNFKAEGELKCNNNVLQFKAEFRNDNFRFFEESGNWSSALNYAHYESEGYSIDENLESAGDGDGNFKFVGTPGIYTLTIDNTAKTIVMTASASLWTVGDAVPGAWLFDPINTVEFKEATPNIWSATITLSNGVFRFFQIFNAWDTNNNFAHYDEAGYTIDPNLVNDGSGDANFKFVGTPGNYVLTVNAIDKKITLTAK